MPGTHAVTTQYDQFGYEMEEHKEDAAGSLTEGFERHTRDRRGNILSTRFFDRDQRPVAQRGTFFAKRYRYDRFDQRIETTYLDAADRPVTVALGFSRIESTRDDRGVVVANHFFDSAGVEVRVTSLGILRFSPRAAGTGGIPGAPPAEEARARADDALAQLNSGVTWEQIRKQLADGLDSFDVVAIDRLPPPLRDAAMALDLGAPSQVVETNNGFVILRRETHDQEEWPTWR